MAAFRKKKQKKEAGMRRLDTRTLNDWWEQLLEQTQQAGEENLEYFSHCTSMKGKESIIKDMKLTGSYTDLPKKAPLASCRDMKGVWFTTSTADLPKKSPYGSQRLLLSPLDLINTLRIPVKKKQELDKARDEGKTPRQQKTNLEVKRKRKLEETDSDTEQPPSKYRAKFYHKESASPTSEPSTVLPTQKPLLPEPSLFFECAHHYRDTQYLRLLMVRSGDPAVEWCEQNCKAVDLRDNPFLCLEEDGVVKGKPLHLWGGNLVTEVFVVGDLDLDMLPRPLTWNTVGTVRRTESDPGLGVLFR